MKLLSAIMKCVGNGGAANQLYRLMLSKEGTLLEEQLVAENHAMMMYQPLLDAQVKENNV